MDRSVARIVSLEIHNFKNVKYGTLDFENSRKAYTASILGLYGQNGSGKTALIDALALLKLNLCGQPVPTAYADYVNVDAPHATLKYSFKITNSAHNSEYYATYEFSIRKDIDTSVQNLAHSATVSDNYKTTIFNEVLSYSYKDPETKVKFLPVIDTNTEEVFLPKRIF